MKTNGLASSSDSCTSTTSTMSVADCHITTDISSSVTPTPSSRFSHVMSSSSHAGDSTSSSEMFSFSAKAEISRSSKPTVFLSPTSPPPLDASLSPTVSSANFNPIVTITTPEEEPQTTNPEAAPSQSPPFQHSETPTADQATAKLTALTPSQPSIEFLEAGSISEVPSTSGSREPSVEVLDWPPSEAAPVRVFKPPPFRRVISNLDAILEHEDMGGEKNLRRFSSLTALNSTISSIPRPATSHAREEAVRRVRFYIGASKRRSHRTKMAEKIPEPDDPPKEFQRSRMSSFKNFFRGSSKRKKRKSLEEAHENLRIDGNVIKRSSPVPIVLNQGESADDAQESAEPEQHVIVSPGENDDLEELDLVEDSSFWKPRDFSFQRSHSTKSRLKPLLEDDDLDTHVIARSYTEANLLSHYPAFLMRPIHAHRDASREHGDKKKGSSASDDGGGSQRRGVFSRRSHRAGDHAHAGSKHGRQSKGSHRDSLRRHVVQLLTRRKSKSGHTTSQQSLHRGHSLASVELGSWAARGHRRGSALPPFCSSLSPTEASSRTEILQTISSAIIHLFQRKPLKDNELGVLQEHVRFLINSEAGGLVHEYYKDQLLRKGMIILREKIKNEQGLELLKQLGETWDYFFREILPVLQAILYPLSSSLSKEETVRSLSLLAFRNIVVLKVSVKEALDSVSKGDYPVNIPQMLLVLQSIQDNVFLSENQFLLEKLVARVVCPYLGQRGVYEGSPDPVIKVKLKPIPFNIPNVIVSDNDKYTSKAQYKLDNPTSPSPVVTRRGAFQDLSGLKKLKPVLEHVYDGGRRHSIMS